MFADPEDSLHRRLLTPKDDCILESFQLRQQARRCADSLSGCG